MSSEPEFRADLYRGTARFYDEFRIAYPRHLLDDLRVRARIRGTGKLLDLACGTGQITFGLGSSFAEVWAVDQEPEAVEFARAKALRHGVDNVRWITGRAEDVDAAGFTIVGEFDFETPYEWSVEQLIGFMYSTSVLSQQALGRNVQAFERDLRERLLAVVPDGILREDISFSYTLASRP